MQNLILTLLEYTNCKSDLIEYKCLCCNKNYQQKSVEKLKNNLLIPTHFPTWITVYFLLRKGFYHYEYMDDWEKFIKTWLPEKENFSSF